eukprot:4055005-Lingulodinium_polyedra.AAC.2
MSHSDDVKDVGLRIMKCGVVVGRLRNGVVCFLSVVPTPAFGAAFLCVWMYCECIGDCVVWRNVVAVLFWGLLLGLSAGSARLLGFVGGCWALEMALAVVSLLCAPWPCCAGVNARHAGVGCGW